MIYVITKRAFVRYVDVSAIMLIHFEEQNQMAIVQINMPEQPRTGAWKFTRGPNVGPLIHGLLLAGDVDYERVARSIRIMIPGAQTSVKSVGSTATRLRNKGHVIPYRNPVTLGG